MPFLTKKTEGPDASMKERRGVREGEGLKMIKLRREEKDKEKKAYWRGRRRNLRQQNIKTQDRRLPNKNTGHLSQNNHQNSRSSISPKWPLKPLSSSSYTITEIMFGWPSGLRRQFKALVYS